MTPRSFAITIVIASLAVAPALAQPPGSLSRRAGGSSIARRRGRRGAGRAGRRLPAPRHVSRQVELQDVAAHDCLEPSHQPAPEPEGDVEANRALD